MMKKINKYLNIVKDGRYFSLIIILGFLYVIIITPTQDIGSLLVASLALILAVGSYLVSIQSREMTKDERRMRYIETSLEKFYIPLYNLLTNLYENTTTNYQEKINVINSYIHLAEPCTRYRFRTYQKTNWFHNELLEQVTKDIEAHQKEYNYLVKQLP